MTHDYLERIRHKNVRSISRLNHERGVTGEKRNLFNEHPPEDDSVFSLE
jgi:hypothetical protein